MGIALVAGWIVILGEVGREVDCDAAALAVEGSHRQAEGAGENVRGDAELEAVANAGDLEVVGSGLGEGGEVNAADRVA